MTIKPAPADRSLRNEGAFDVSVGAHNMTVSDRDNLLRLGRLVEPLIKEIRAPLGNLVAATDMLSESLKPDDPVSGFARLMRRESERIRQMLAELATLAFPPEASARAVDLSGLVADILDAARSDAGRQGIALDAILPDEPLYVWVDPDMLRSALGTLPGHAVDAMPYGGRLTVSAERVEEDGETHARVRFSDTGPDVPPEQMARLFEPFFIAEGRRPGLALAMCRVVVERMGGNVTTRSGAGGGLTIEIRLPLP